MPDMKGDQVATAIKSANPSVPVVMLTGSASMMDDDEKPTSVDFIVGKPVTIEGLRAAVSKAVASVNRPTRPSSHGSAGLPRDDYELEPIEVSPRHD
jgi:FixJ family two-component response regulator